MSYHPVGYHRHGSPYKRGGRYGSLGDVQSDMSGKGTDFVGVYIIQRNEARRAFGEIPFGGFSSAQEQYRKTGRTDIAHPRLSHAYATKLVKYWQNEASRVRSHASDIPDSAHRSAWLRAVTTLATIPGAGQSTALVQDATAKRIWDLLIDVVLPMKAMQETPTKWQLMKESIGEATWDFLGKLKWLLIAGVGYIGWNEYTKRRKT